MFWGLKRNGRVDVVSTSLQTLEDEAERGRYWGEQLEVVPVEITYLSLGRMSDNDAIWLGVVEVKGN